MMRNRFILLLIVIFALLPVCISAQIITRTITDVDNGMAVSFASIYKSDSTLLCSANVDGVFSIEVMSGSYYKISRIGYKPIKLTAEQLLSDKAIKMEMLPYEINTVVVTANSALSDINRALDSTSKNIPSTPFFQRCYKKEEIVAGNDTILDAKAIVDFNIRKKNSAGKGIKYIPKLKGLQIDYNNNGLEDLIPIANLSPTIPINVSLGETIDKNTVYTHINFDNDSITIIAFHPKNYYSSREIYPSGRFIINTRTWCILRIDMFADNNSIEYSNHLAETSNTIKITRVHSVSIFYSANCLPSKVEQKTVYYLKIKPEELITRSVLHIYKDISKTEYQQKPSGSYNPEKFILQQKPVTIIDFDSRFNQGFQ